MHDPQETPDALKALEKAIKEAESRHNKASGKNVEPDDSAGSGMASAMRVSAELVAGVAVGGFLGYWLDQWLDTRPIFLALCMILGVAGSLLNIYREIQK